MRIENNCVYRALTEISSQQHHQSIRRYCEEACIGKGVYTRSVLTRLQTSGVLSLDTMYIERTMSQAALRDQVNSRLICGEVFLIRNNGEVTTEVGVAVNGDPGHLEAFVGPLTLAKDLVLDSCIAKAVAYGGEIMAARINLTK